MSDRPIAFHASTAQLHVLQHALGVDGFGQGEQYRTHFVTGEGSDDHPDCMALVASGLMTRRCGKTLPFGGNDLFHVTEAGRAYMVANSPPPPRMSRAQKRYRAWLDLDGSMTFGDYIRAGLGA